MKYKVKANFSILEHIRCIVIFLQQNIICRGDGIYAIIIYI